MVNAKSLFINSSVFGTRPSSGATRRITSAATGTAEKTSKNGGYDAERVLATFASFFPSEDPKYVLIITLDEPEDRMGVEPKRTAGYTAVPVAAEVIRRVAPLLGLVPKTEELMNKDLALTNH